MNKLSVIFDRSRMPLYLQLASVMRQRIEAGRWQNGDKISTIEELEAEFGVAKITISKAIEILREEKMLDSRQGLGTFVSYVPKERHWLNIANDLDGLISSIKDNRVEIVYIEEKVASPPLGEGEGVPAHRYALLRSVQYNGDEPFSVVNLHLSQEIFARERKQFTRLPALPRIMEMKDISISHAYQTVTIGIANPEVADLLKIGLGEPTADCRIVLLDDRNVAIYVADFHYHRNCFALRRDLMNRG